MDTKGQKRLYILPTILILGTLVLSSCGYKYKCGITFGASTCTPSGSGIGTTGNGTSVAFAFNIVGTGTINGISLTSGTGAALQNISGFTAPTVPSGDVSSELVIAQKQFVYAAFPGSQSLYGWSIDPTTGNLTAVSGSPYSVVSLGGVIPNSTGVNMSAIAVNPAGTLLYIAGAGFGEIDAYQISSTGTLTQVPGAPFSTIGTIQPRNLSFDGLGKYLYVTSGPEGQGGQVAAYSIQTSGALTLVPGSPFAFNMWEMQGDPSGQYMIGISGRSSALNGLADDTSLYVFSIQQSGANAGALTQVSGSPFTTVYAPVNLAVQPVASNGSFVYSFSVNALAPNAIEGYQLDPTSGALTAMSTSPFSNVGTSPWGQFDQSGAYLFIFDSSASGSALGVMNVASGTGDLSEPLPPLTIDSTSTYFGVTDAP
jgi:6-phosphogluconolactonase (cycloisomerase 2 family)